MNTVYVVVDRPNRTGRKPGGLYVTDPVEKRVVELLRTRTKAEKTAQSANDSLSELFAMLFGD